MAQNSLLKTLSKISLGIVIILVWAYFWIRADILFPVNTESWKFDYILTFIVLLSFIFAWDTIRGSKTEKSLFQASFIKKAPVFLISSLITLVLLVLLGLTLSGNSVNTISQAIGQVSLGVILIHALMISIGEELIFRGWLPERLREAGINKNATMWISTIVFALFHAGLGKSILTLLTYIPLGLIFYQIKIRYSPQTNMANAGVHFAWNLFILGFLT